MNNKLLKINVENIDMHYGFDESFYIGDVKLSKIITGHLPISIKEYENFNGSIEIKINILQPTDIEIQTEGYELEAEDEQEVI